MVKTLRGLAILAAMATAGSLGAAAPASADPSMGTIVGHFTDGGAPMSGVTVFVSKIDGTAFSYSSTDSSGFYRTSELPPGDYKVEFDMRWGKQYAYQQLAWDTATIFPLSAGAEVTVDDSLLPTGSMSGTFRARDGSGIAGVQVSGIGNEHVITDANGNWQMPKVFARSDYLVYFTSYERRIYQFAYGKTYAYEADKIAVTAGVNTVVNDTLLPTGSIRVIARNSVTGATISNFSAFAATSFASTETGEIILSDIPIGTHLVGAYANGYINDDSVPVTVTEGQQAEVAVTMDPPSRIEATVIDAVTGAPLAGVCVAAVNGQHRPFRDVCESVSDAQGKLSIEYLRSGTYQLLALPTQAPGYGIQWVGASRGTGKQHLATSVTVGVGQTATGPVVKMDRAGSIIGRVTKPSGEPAQGTAGIYSLVSPSGEVPFAESALDSDGNYRIDNLGPYDWQLVFSAYYEARQYSGAVANRLLARAVPVTVGGTSTYNFQMRAATAVTVTIEGVSEPHPTVYFHNAITGDRMEYRTVYPEQFTVTMPVVGPQFVKIAVSTNIGLQWVGGTDQASARLFWIPGSGSKTIQISF